MNLRAIIFFWTILYLAVPGAIMAQEQPSLFYYLPNGQYDPAIPTPKSWLGFEIGERHASHDQLLGYMRELDRLSPRITLQEYGKSYELRPLVCLTVTHPENQANIEDIRQKRRALAAPEISNRLNPADFPGVVYMGYSIHGNETSGSNAAIAFAYWLAAAQGAEIEAILKNTIILLDPCFNPDGMQRFSSWVNSRRSANGQPNPVADEFNEHWPGGRYNHYWFDLNRDWLVMQQPESEGRVRIFQDWLPNVLTDHHEMGSNSTFFFQPGVPSRVNPVTPQRNQQLTAEIAKYHAKALSEKGIQFYSGENYDDFYYGKGSTYPDANGSIGILFEQGSSRGSAQETTNGLLTFAYTIRNQVITSFSTLKAVNEKRTALNSYLREFYQSAREEAKKSDIKAYILQPTSADTDALEELAGRIFAIHNIKFYGLNKSIVVNGTQYEAGNALVVPVEQNQYRLIRAIFERNTIFKDSIFYDISAWTLPDAFGLEWASVDNKFNYAWSDLLPWSGAAPAPPAAADSAAYAYIIPADAPGISQVLVSLHTHRYRVKVATQPFVVNGNHFAPGTLVINNDRQSGSFKKLKNLLDESKVAGVYLAVSMGNSDEGPWLGSNSFVVCQRPEVLLITGAGVSPQDAGEIWHYLDTRLGIAPVMVESDRLKSISLKKYTTLIMPDGNYSNLPIEPMKAFVNEGGTLIATGNALNWLKSVGLCSAEIRQGSLGAVANKQQLAYAGRDDARAARTMPGSIFLANIDVTHPLCYGYRSGKIPVFMPDALFLEPSLNSYQNPVQLTKQPLIAGYLHTSQAASASGAAAVAIQTVEKGRVISFAMNPNFRSFWWGSQRLMGNAVLFGPLIK